MAKARCYKDGCAGAHALDIVGERWALLVARELMLGPRRFTDLRSALPGISPNVLSQRLEDLAQAGVLVQKKLPPPYAVSVYELTEWGSELEPVIRQLGAWGARSPQLPRGNPISVNSVILSFRTMFRSELANGVNLTIGLELDGRSFTASVDDKEFEVRQAQAEDPDATLSAGPEEFAQLAFDGLTLSDALRDELVELSGDQRAAERFFACFALPEPALAAGG